MNRLALTALAATLLSLPLLGQTAEKVAAINRKVIGKWWTSDKKEYLEFLGNGDCSEGALWADGKWHVEQGKLSAWEKGEEFICVGGALTFIAPDMLTRDYGMGGTPTRYYRGLQRPRPVPTLTLALAQRILSQQINMPTVNNSIFTCHACYDPADKEDNDKAPVVSTYSSQVDQFLRNQSYIRSIGDRQVFTAKAKRSKYYEADEGGGGLRVVTFKNPRVLTAKIIDPSHVPIEYDFVPTEVTMALFGKIQRVKSFASFSYGNEEWRMCIACGQ
jgi:hypothetical protein